MTARDPVIVVGAGPTGLMSALALGKQGIPVVLCEAEPALTQDLRAGSFHPPSLEMMAPYGITERMLRIGIPEPRWQIRDRRSNRVAEFDVGILRDVTAYPYRLLLEQHRLTSILLDIIRKETTVDIQFSHHIKGVKQFSDGVVVDLEHEGKLKRVVASWLIGADGGRSTVRTIAGFAFEGFTWPEKFLVLGTPHDLGRYGYANVAYIADPKEWVAVFHMPHDGPPGVWRLVFPVALDTSEHEALSAASIEKRMQDLLPRPEPWPIVYKNIYRTHQRVADTFRKGRILLAGDAAHLNNPLGGFGLNCGIHDAINLAEKLSRVWQQQASEELLDLYSRQRRTVTLEHVQKMSIRNKRMLEESDQSARRRQFAELTAIAGDPKRARAHVYAASMLLDLEREKQVG